MTIQRINQKAQINLVALVGETYPEAMSLEAWYNSPAMWGAGRMQFEVESAELIIDRSGVVEILADGAERHRNRLRLLLIGMQLLARRNEKLTVAGVHRLLTRELSWGLQRRLGVIESTSVEGKKVWSDDATIKLHQLHRVGRNLTSRLAFTEASAPDVDACERARRLTVVRAYGDALMGLSRPWWTGETAVHEFEIQSWGRPYVCQRDELRIVADPTWSHRRDVDARWGKRRHRHTTESLFGYREFAEMQHPTQGSFGARPALIRQFVVAPMDATVTDTPLIGRSADSEVARLVERNAYQLARRYDPGSGFLRRGEFQTFGLTWLHIVVGLVNASVNHQNLLRWWADSQTEQTPALAWQRTFPASKPSATPRVGRTVIHSRLTSSSKMKGTQWVTTAKLKS